VLLPYRSLLGFLVLLPLMWAGLRGNRRNVATAALIFFGIAVWGFSVGSDPFPKTDLNGALLSLLVLSISVSCRLSLWLQQLRHAKTPKPICFPCRTN
jgi:hypothetical protein